MTNKNVLGAVLCQLCKFAGLTRRFSTRSEREVEMLKIVANRRAEAVNAKWGEDVRMRKLCIANCSGSVYGIQYDLEGQFGIGLRRIA